MYSYNEMSNKVVYSKRLRSDSATDSNPHLMRGLISTKDMGSAVKQTIHVPPEVTTWTKTTAEEEELTLDQLSAVVYRVLPDLSLDTVYGATEAIAEICTSILLDTKQKRQEVTTLLGEPVSDDIFQEMVRLSKLLGDEWGGAAVTGDEGELALALESDDDDGPVKVLEDFPDVPGMAPEREEQPEASKFVSATEIAPKAEESTTKTIPLDDIGPMTVHKMVMAALEDAEEAHTMALTVALLIDRVPELDAAAFENEVMEALDYDHFDVVNSVVENRWRIYWKLQWLDDPERTETKLKNSQDHHQILTELTGDTEERPAKRSRTEKPVAEEYEPKIVDIEAYKLALGLHKPAVSLPKGTYQEAHHDWDCITVPPPPAPEQTEELISIDTLPEWCQPVFGDTRSLNRIQLAVYPDAFELDANMLICAPTGAGKTNIAMLTLLRVASHHSRDKPKFKAVYVAPLKALVQEQVREFSRRLPWLEVLELTGDSDASTLEIASANILVVTPEKWDVITRKLPRYAREVELLMIDEIHLLHDERGPVLESLITRTRRDPRVRIVGLLATLPNYQDVANFIGATAVHYFDSLFRPCPLRQQFFGVKGRGMKKVQAMNAVVHQVVASNLKEGHQVIVFVHLRKETGKLALEIGEKLDENPPSAGVAQILKLEASQFTNNALKQALPTGVGCHHAGLLAHERSVVEDLFAQGHLRVLVLTATLAWGVNLPAHTVVIRGTELYLARDGGWVQLSPQDILQMLGRAGRPRYDTLGDGIVITSRDWLQYYLAVTNQQLPIELSMPEKLVDALNAEVVAGTITSFDDAVRWVNSTYYAIRARQDPKKYGITDADATMDNLAHLALTRLAEGQLVVYEDGQVQLTELGKIASHFYLAPATIATYLKLLRAWHSKIDVLLVFSQLQEFCQVSVRVEERAEVKKLATMCPIPIKEDPVTGPAKINILLQAYLLRANLYGFALAADMTYISQSAGRLFAALAQICIVQGWARASKMCLQMALLAQRCQWPVETPFRQLTGVSDEVIRATLSAYLPLQAYFNPETLENFQPAVRQQLPKLVERFPKVTIGYLAQTITPLVLRLQLELELLRKHRFTVIIDACDNIVWCDLIVIEGTKYLDLFVPLLEPVPQVYQVTAILSEYLHCTYSQAMITTRIVVPKSFPAPVPVPLVSLVPTERMKAPFPFESLNRFQSAALPALWNTQENVIVAMAKGNGRSTLGVVAVLAWLKLLPADGAKALVVSPDPKATLRLFKDVPAQVAVLLGKELGLDFAAISKNHVLIATAQAAEALTRRWRLRSAVQAFELVVADDIHQFLWQYEVLLCRLKLISTTTERPLRTVALGNYFGNARDMGEWLGVPKKLAFAFSGAERVNPCAIKLVVDGDKPVPESGIIYASLRRQCLELAAQIHPKGYDHAALVEEFTSDDPAVVALLARGVGVWYTHMSPRLQRVVTQLWNKHALAAVVSMPGINVRASDVVVWEMLAWPVSQVLDLVALADAHATVYAPHNQITQYGKFLSYDTPLPVESGLRDSLGDVLLGEIIAGTVSLLPDCVEWISESYFYRRIQLNPSFYEVPQVTHEAISAFLSESVETTVEELEKARILATDDDDNVSAANFGLIAAHHRVSVATMSVLVASLTERTRLKGLLGAISQASELVIDVNEQAIASLLAQCPVSMENAPPAFWLLQAYFSRLKVGPELRGAMLETVDKVLPVVNAAVDILSLQGFLNAMAAMDISQMVVQSKWLLDLPLVQLPHVLAGLLERAKKHDVSTIFDIMALEDDERDAVLAMNDDDLEDVAEFVNSYPNVDVLLETPPASVVVDEPFTVLVVLERDEDAEDLVVVCPDIKKNELWWVVVGDPLTKQLYALRKTIIAKEHQQLTLEVSIPTTGSHLLLVWAICDSYADADKEVTFDVQVNAS